MAFLFILTLPGKSKIEKRNQKNKEGVKNEIIKQELWEDASRMGRGAYFDCVPARCIASYMYDHLLLCLRDWLSQSGYLPCMG